MFLLYGWPTKDITLFPVATNCQRSAPLQIFNTLQAGFEPVENLSSGLVEWSCAVVINTTPQRHYYNQYTTTLYAERLGYEFVTMFVTFVCISYFASQIRINLSRDTFLVSRRKKGYKVCIFLWNMDVQMFDILNVMMIQHVERELSSQCVRGL